MILRGCSHWTKRFISRKLLCSLYGIPVKKTESSSSPQFISLKIIHDLFLLKCVLQIIFSFPFIKETSPVEWGQQWFRTEPQGLFRHDHFQMTHSVWYFYSQFPPLRNKAKWIQSWFGLKEKTCHRARCLKNDEQKCSLTRGTRCSTKLATGSDFSPLRGQDIFLILKQQNYQMTHFFSYSRKE